MMKHNIITPKLLILEYIFNIRNEISHKSFVKIILGTSKINV